MQSIVGMDSYPVLSIIRDIFFANNQYNIIVSISLLKWIVYTHLLTILIDTGKNQPIIVITVIINFTTVWHNFSNAHP